MDGRRSLGLGRILDGGAAWKIVVSVPAFLLDDD